MRVLDWVIAVEMHDEGRTLDQIAAFFGVSWWQADSMVTFGCRVRRFPEDDPPLEVVLSRRSYNVLTSEGLLKRDDRLSALRKLDGLPDYRLLTLRNFGRKSFNELKELRALLDA